MTPRSITRRAVCAGMVAGWTASSRLSDANAHFELLDLEFEQEPQLARRCRVVVPRGSFEEPLPVLVLLHGLAETRDPGVAVDAWLSLYGLAGAWQRLRAGKTGCDKQKSFSDAEARILDEALVKRPFRGMVVACPFMPNPHAFHGGSRAMLAGYAKWLRDALLPQVRGRIPKASHSRDATGIAGVSLGGFAALELGLRAPDVFATVGTVQGAFGAGMAQNYARQIAELDPKSLRGAYVATSAEDPYRAANERLYRELGLRGVPARLSVRRGPHSQAWLREIGTLETLLWHDRALRGNLERGELRSKRP